MNVTDLPEKGETTIYSLFKNMNLKPAVESVSLASSKIEKYSSTCGFVDGKFIDNNDSHKCTISFAAESSTKGFKTWSSLSANSRSKILFNIAQALERHQPMLTSLELVSSGKHAYKVKTKDVPYLIESFDYFAGCVLQLAGESKAWFPIGPVCVIPEEYNNPSLTLSLRVSSVLGSGNSVLLLPDLKSSYSALFLAEICSESGLPDGVLNVLSVDFDALNKVEKWPVFSKFLFTGSSEKALEFSKLSSKASLPYEVLIPRRPVVIVYENADLRSAANSVLEATFYHDTRSKSGGCKVLIQECICAKFLKILEGCFSNILVGSNLSKTDVSCKITDEQKTVLTECIAKAQKGKAKVTSLSTTDEDLNYTHMMPVIISGLQTNSKLVHEELGGPIIITVPFRTVKESISMFNCDNKGSPVSIWSEKISVAIEVALKLKSGVVWVNSENVIDARTAFSCIYSSGTSTEGGKDALFNHMSVLPEALRVENSIDKEKYDSMTSIKLPKILTGGGMTVTKTEYKLYIGGVLKESANGTITINENTLVPNGNESDIQSAVSSALAAQPKWEALTDSQKRKILLEIISKLKMNSKEYVAELQKVSGESPVMCEKEVEDAMDVLYCWASKHENFNGPMQEIKKNLIVLQNRNPLGVIGIQCPNEKPFLSFLSLIIPAIVFGNTVVAITSAKYPTLALKMCEIFTLCNIPGGAINVISGNTSHLMPALCKHTGVNAIWYTDVSSNCVLANRNITQRVFCCQGMWSDLNKAKNRKLALESTYSKTIFLPAGEVYAN